MADNLEAILLRLGLDASGFTKGSREARKELGLMEKGVGSLKGQLLSLAVAAGAGIGLAKLAGDALEFADSVQKVHDQTGLAVETIQFLRIAADQTGGSVEGLASMVSKMQRQIVEAGTNKTLQKNFRDMGLEIDALRAMSPDDQFKTIADAIAGISDPAMQATAAVAAFGKAGADSIPQLEAISSKAGEIESALARIGGPVSAEAIAAVDALGDSTSLTKTALTNMATELLSEVAPACVSFLETVQMVVGGLRVLDGVGGDAMVNLDNKIEDATQKLKQMQHVLGQRPTEEGDKLIAQQKELIRTLTEEYNARQNLGLAGAKRFREEQAAAAARKAAADAALGEITEFVVSENVLREAALSHRHALETAAEAKLFAMREEARAQEFAAVQEDRLREQAFLDGFMAEVNTSMAAMGEEASALKIQTWQQETSSIAQLLEQQTAGVSRHSKAMFEINKAAGIVNTTINTIEAVVKAWKDYGWPVGAIVGAAVAAAGAAQVQAIASTRFGSKTSPSQAAQPAVPTAPAQGGGGGGGGQPQTLRVEGIGADSLLTGKMVRSLSDRISEHVRDGGRVEFA